MKKSLSLLLLLLLLLPLFSLFSCAESGENTETAGAASGDGSEAETKEFFPAVERKDYGAEFNMIGYVSPGQWYYADELTQEVLNDAVYDMNMRVADHLGIEFYYEQMYEVNGHELVDKVLPTVESGDDSYQMCILHPYYGYNSIIGKNAAYDFYDLTSLDLDQSYWNREVIDSLAINGHAYIALGDLCKYTLNIIYANKNRLTDAQREMPYDSVRNGTWTMDEFYGLTKDLYVDLDGDGKRTNSDMYGFAGLWDANGASMLQAADIYVATRNEEDQFTISLEGDRLIDFYDGLYTWSKDESVFLWDFASAMSNTGTLSFLDNRSVFTLNPLGTSYLSADFDVGMLPLPKYDAEQEKYRHVNWGNNIVVPTTISDELLVGDVLELMAFYSQTIVQEAYYDTVLQYKVSNAPADREMVQLIYHNVVYDPGIAFCDGVPSLNSLVYVACFGIRQNTPKLTSYLKSNVKSAQKSLDKLFKTKS
ncbi:MAG: hypothetical protein MJ192_08865 [Clostridia bacterium]|nr:hypothetical protein [Clostridia bacterium]